MSRSTQHIGLNLYAENLVRNSNTCTHYDMTTGIAGEPIAGRIFHLRDNTVLMEVVQAEPWSSGPMIFTCLKDVTFIPEYYASPEKYLEQIMNEQDICAWMYDPSLDEEFCYVTGRYSV